MTTTQNIHDNLPHAGSTVLADTLKAVKEAIGVAWPTLKVNEYQTGVATLSNQTFIYSLAAVTDLTELGVAQVFVDPGIATSEPEILKRGVSQYRDGTTWWLKFSPAAASAHDGKAVNIRYQRRITLPADEAEALDTALPDVFLTNYVMDWYARRILTIQGADHRAAIDQMLLYEKRWRDSLTRNMVPPIPHIVSLVPHKDRLT